MISSAITETYGLWTVLDTTDRFWLCRCACGNERAVNRADLRSGRSKGCGCTRKAAMRAAQKAAVTVHGMEGTPTYQSWVDMRRRCNNPTRRDYPRYGGRGIKVCPQWSDFTRFLQDMGVRPEGMTLDRMDNDGDYEPGNCKWATKREQGRNTRTNKTVTVNGEPMTMIEACEKHGADYQQVKGRMRRGWTIERALGIVA